MYIAVVHVHVPYSANFSRAVNFANLPKNLFCAFNFCEFTCISSAILCPNNFAFHRSNFCDSSKNRKIREIYSPRKFCATCIWYLRLMSFFVISSVSNAAAAQMESRVLPAVGGGQRKKGRQRIGGPSVEK